MGNGATKGASNSRFTISVKTSDRLGAGTDSGVFVILHDKNGLKSEPHKLDKLFRNDFERGKIDMFKITTKQLDEITDLEIWIDGFGVNSLWHLEYVAVENPTTKMEKVFPFHRWLQEDEHYFIEAFDCTLPQNSKFKDQRDLEMEEKKVKYNYRENFPKIPLQVQFLHEDDRFAEKFAITLTTRKIGCLLEKYWAGIFRLNRKDHVKSFDEVVQLYDNFKEMDMPTAAKHWREDWYFGHSMKNNCNPKLIALCRKIPDKFAVNEETLKPILEGKTIAQAIESKRLFIIDLTILEQITWKNDFVLTSPFCLLYVNDKKVLLPVAIQLFKEPGPENPVFYPTDDPNVWLLAKMWYNLGDVLYHQSVTHLGATHLLMESIAISMARNLSQSHPIHKLLSPHLLYLLAINTRGVNKLISKGGWVDMTVGSGREGMLTCIGLVLYKYDLMGSGDLVADLKKRGVDDEEVLPDYYYREDGVLLYNIINKYVKEMVALFYPTEQDIVNDREIQAWREELTRERPHGPGYTGVPGDGKFTTHEHLSSLLTYLIFTCSVEHAAVNFSQYDSYGFYPAYPLKLRGAPPKDKSPKTEQDIIDVLCDKEQMMNQMIVTYLLSKRGTRPLGDFEVVYHYRPDAQAAVARFRAELKQAEDTNDKRDAARKLPYLILNPRHVPNSISI